MEVRSYRPIFELDRRVYKIDTVRLNPAGIPLRGIVYAVTLILTAIVVCRLEPVRTVLAPVPWYVREVGLPIAAAALATIVRIEGRPFHLAAWAIAAHCVAPRHTRGFRGAPAPGGTWQPQPVLLIPDGSDAELRRLRYRGPGAVLVCCAHERVEWPRRRLARGGRAAELTLHPLRDGGPLRRAHGLEIAAGAVLETCTRRAR